MAEEAAINLTHAQALHLARIIESYDYSIRIVDKGDGWFEVEQIDALDPSRARPPVCVPVLPGAGAPLPGS